MIGRSFQTCFSDQKPGSAFGTPLHAGQWGSLVWTKGIRMKNSFEQGKERKKAIFDAMSPRRQRHILKKGYDKWEPFQEPKDPIDIRKDKSKRTTHMLVQEFLQSKKVKGFSPAYSRGVLEISIGIVNDDDRFLGMYEFSCWYRDLLRREGYEV